MAALVGSSRGRGSERVGGAHRLPPPPPAVWIEPSSMVGTWQYRAYYMYQAGCWPEGGGTVCMLDSTLEAIDGTVVLGPARDSSFGATYKSWKVPYHLEITNRQWDVLGTCNGAPLSCFTAQAPTPTGTDL